MTTLRLPGIDSNQTNHQPIKISIKQDYILPITVS